MQPCAERRRAAQAFLVAMNSSISTLYLLTRCENQWTKMSGAWKERRANSNKLSQSQSPAQSQLVQQDDMAQGRRS